LPSLQDRDELAVGSACVTKRARRLPDALDQIAGAAAKAVGRLVDRVKQQRKVGRTELEAVDDRQQRGR
jgi:hypothetical protein